MMVAVKQRFFGGPMDGESRMKVYREPNLAEAFDALLPCRFDANGVPLWAAWYHSEPGVDLIVGGSIALAFQDYTHRRPFLEAGSQMEACRSATCTWIDAEYASTPQLVRIVPRADPRRDD